MPVYSPAESHIGLDGTAWNAQVALKVRIRPGTYSIGQATTANVFKIDPHFHNDDLEWYTKGDEAGGHIITGLLVLLRPAS